MDDSIGLIYLNDMTIDDLKIGSNTVDEGYTSISMNSTSEGDTYRIISTPMRRMSEIAIDLGEINNASIERMARFLCKDYMKKIVKENKYEFAFANFQTKEIIPISEDIKAFFIKDYYVHFEWKEDEVDILVMYIPLLIFK